MGERVLIGAGCVDVVEVTNSEPVRIPLTIGIRHEGSDTHVILRVNLILKPKLPVLIE